MKSNRKLKKLNKGAADATTVASSSKYLDDNDNDGDDDDMSIDSSSSSGNSFSTNTDDETDEAEDSTYDKDELTSWHWLLNYILDDIRFTNVEELYNNRVTFEEVMGKVIDATVHMKAIMDGKIMDKVEKEEARLESHVKYANNQALVTAWQHHQCLIKNLLKDSTVSLRRMFPQGRR